ncbi:hypothetical protein [Arsenophonus endosymbiont of Aphis craccivora]|uniref:hypothetical protein n=1 Tax=Arsenophonus endosymbiont of Aphis craccivora TaxID=1231049 RepID=UPI0015DE7DAC|nr:hypothetical protein [Arsenophonus endosymbiont of Aphis craccivora]
MQIAKKQYQDNDLLNIEEVCELIGGISSKTLADCNNTHRHRKVLSPIRFTSKIV